jgi:hypothetical protein
VRPDFAVMLLNDAKNHENDVLRKLNPMNFCLNDPLIRPKNTGWQIDGHRLLVYNTHIKKSSRYITTAASYIFVLSIIPLH